MDGFGISWENSGIPGLTPLQSLLSSPPRPVIASRNALLNFDSSCDGGAATKRKKLARNGQLYDSKWLESLSWLDNENYDAQYLVAADLSVARDFRATIRRDSLVS